MTFAVDFVLGARTLVLCVRADDRDHAFEVARQELRARGLVSAAIQGAARPATDRDIREQWLGP